MIRLRRRQVSAVVDELLIRGLQQTAEGREVLCDVCSERKPREC